MPSLIVLVEETNFPFYTDLVRLEIILVWVGWGAWDGVRRVEWGGFTMIILLISVQLALN